MGIFGRKQDDFQDEYTEDPVPQSAPVQPVSPSVDGVLPPGVQPHPAPSGNNLASQASSQSMPMATVSSSSDDSAGSFIMTAPPVHVHADPPQESEPEIEQSMPEEQEIVNEEPDTMPSYEEQPVAEHEHLPDPEAETEPEPVQEPEEDNRESTNQADGAVHDDLQEIKQQALQQLSPLVGHLDQSPEEKFHTTMMLLQSTDDSSLVKKAYEAAQAITDEKTRAQALLDIVNEINYFNQKQS